jgi:hypothetical protein
MNALQPIADRVGIEPLRGEFSDAVMMRDYDRVASLFTADGALRMPNIPVELAGREEIRAGGTGVTVQRQAADGNGCCAPAGNQAATGSAHQNQNRRICDDQDRRHPRQHPPQPQRRAGRQVGL